MKGAYKPVWGLLIILLGVTAVVVGSTWWKPKEIVPWRTDLTAARAEAEKDGRPVFLYLTASWCGPCQSLKSTTWADRDVEQALRGYVPVKVDVDEHPDVAKRYLFTPQNLQGGVPAFRVLDAQGAVRKELVGAASPGQFLKWLNG